MRSPVPKRTNAIWIQNVMRLMDGAIHCGELELLWGDCARAENQLEWTKKAYINALRFAGRLSFDAQDVSTFESKSIRLEEIIRELQQRHSSWKNVSEQLLAHRGPNDILGG